MVPKDLVLILKDARGRTTQNTWLRIGSDLELLTGEDPSTDDIRDIFATRLPPDVGWSVAKALDKSPINRNQLAGVVYSIDALFEGHAPTSQIIWSGPKHGHFPVRRLDQYLYDLIANAKERILLVTFAANKISRLCEHLNAALKRGVKLTLIVECEEASEGQLTRDALYAFRDLLSDAAQIYYWPASQRERNQKGRLGKLHVKCAIVDTVAIIGSANLTDDAFNRNMELGVSLTEANCVQTIREHFDGLIVEGILRKLDH